MSLLDYDIYTVPDQEENTVALAERMLSVTNPAKLIKDANTSPVIEKYDIKDVCRMLNDFSYENCKILLTGKGILENEEIGKQLGDPISEIKKEHWIHSKYRIYKKPANPREACDNE